ncbi:MAG: hypothetical protein N2109_00235 [Fimbriimonadales bacterium]|nr:hypothetical protein [Fimbriimonadales bacterium]
MLDKAADAWGGIRMLARLQTLAPRLKMEFETGSRGPSFTITDQVPDKIRVEADLVKRGKMFFGCDGRTAWSKNPHGGLRKPGWFE